MFKQAYSKKMKKISTLFVFQVDIKMFSFHYLYEKEMYMFLNCQNEFEYKKSVRIEL